MPPQDFAFLAKSLRGQICDSSALWSSISDLFFFFCQRFCPTFSIIPRLTPINSNKKMPLPPFKECFDVSSLFLLRGEMTFQWMLLNNVLWVAPDQQAVYLGDNYTLSLPYWMHVQCKNRHIYISHLRRRINIVIYYSTIMSFCHIRSREGAKYETVNNNVI